MGLVFVLEQKDWRSMPAPNKACSGLGGGPCEKAGSRRKHFSVSLVGSPTKPLTPTVGRSIILRSATYV
jgi:hypothetical protein